MKTVTIKNAQNQVIYMEDMADDQVNANVAAFVAENELNLQDLQVTTNDIEQLR